MNYRSVSLKHFGAFYKVYNKIDKDSVGSLETEIIQRQNEAESESTEHLLDKQKKINRTATEAILQAREAQGKLLRALENIELSNTAYIKNLNIDVFFLEQSRMFICMYLDNLRKKYEVMDDKDLELKYINDVLNKIYNKFSSYK